MLGKLIKFEFKQTVRLVSTIYMIIGILGAVLLLATTFGATWIRGLSGLFLSFSGFVAIIMTIVMIVSNFRSSLYGRQGYLSFTLPVKCSQLLMSKIIVSILWTLITMVVVFVVYLLLYFSLGNGEDHGFAKISDLINNMGISELLPSKGVVVELLVIAALWIMMNIVIAIGLVFFSITVANTRALQKKPGFYGMLVFLATFIGLNAISAPITEYLPLSASVTTQSITFSFATMGSQEAILSFGLGGTIFKTIIAVILLVITGWIMENKVNIK